MGFIRLIHQQHYDPEQKRFKSLAFKPSSDGSGISVINTDCALQNSPTICAHIHRYYRETAGTPPIFWDIPTEILELCQFVQQIGSTGDECHYNLTGLTEREARTIFKSIRLLDFHICTETGN